MSASLALINAILGEDRLLPVLLLVLRVTPLIRSTDSEGQEFTMIDTAGMRKSGKVYENTGEIPVMRANEGH